MEKNGMSWRDVEELAGVQEDSDSSWEYSDNELQRKMKPTEFHFAKIILGLIESCSSRKTATDKWLSITGRVISLWAHKYINLRYPGDGVITTETASAVADRLWPNE